MQLWQALVGDGRGSGVLHCWAGDRFERYPWSEVVAEARSMAGGLRRAGVEPGTPVATVLTNSPPSVAGLLGVWLAGGVVASLPVPARGMELEEYGAQLSAICADVEASLFVAEDRLLGVLPEPIAHGVDARSWESLAGGPAIEPSPPEDGEIAFVQYSSGSTGAPKGCMLTAGAIASQLELLADMAAASPGEETVCSWLPLSHDMGVFGCLLFAWAWDFDLVLGSPERFMLSPRTWFRDMADCGATLTAGTSSALHFAARGQRSRSLGRELRLRVCVIGAERIEWEALAGAIEAFGPCGLRPGALMPAYGLAEATLAVTANGVDREPRAIAVDTVALADGEVREVAFDEGTTMVSVGRPCKGVGVRLAHPEGLADVYVRSPSLSAGYVGDAERTRERFRDGEPLTGDLGFMLDGELYVAGRSDDVLSVSGRNVYARELEAAIGSLGGVRTGCCTIVDVAGDRVSRLVLLLELNGRAGELGEIAATATDLARARAGVNLSECVFLEKGALPKTPTGKVQRFRCRQLLEAERLDPLARIATDGAPLGGGARGALEAVDA